MGTKLHAPGRHQGAVEADGRCHRIRAQQLEGVDTLPVQRQDPRLEQSL